MKRKNFLITVTLLLLSPLAFLQAQMTVSGILDSSVSMRAGAADSAVFSCGIEEFANIRFQSRFRDGKGAFYGAVNVFAVAGSYANDAQVMAEMMTMFEMTPPGFTATPYVAGKNYIAGVELERLYFRLNGEHTDFDAGLFRLPFGYGQVWGPSDFLNPKNPLKPDARPRGVLGAGLTWYPIDELKILGFSAAPRDPFFENGEGGLIGFSMDRHWEKASVQWLYAYELPQRNPDIGDSSKYGIHRAGLSVKADIELGFVMDVLYTYNHEAWTKHEGLSFSAGLDYSFIDGNLIVLAEYLYNGKSSSTSINGGGSFSNEHYLYSGFTWRFNDFTNMTIALISGFDDVSFTPFITVSHELFPGATLTVAAQFPMDRDYFNSDGNRGEFGPIPPDPMQPLLLITEERMGRYFDLTTKLRLRF
ncbi:MAG: hypothetical protein LBU66_01675 [Treponema sp.]|nr:hypothetical protein [Treponema sp.]